MSASFYRGAAIASIVSALTTLALILLPRFYPPVPDLDARMALRAETAYILRSWIYLVHPFIVFTAMLAVAARCRRSAGGAASLGLAGFALWAATEAAQQALTKVAFDRTWRTAWLTADEAGRAVIREQVAFYDVLWGSMYLLILLGFLAGSVFLAIAVARMARAEAKPAGRAKPLAMCASGALWAGAALTLVFLVPELGGPELSGFDGLYPFIQPAGRALVGVWLWHEAAIEPDPGRVATGPVSARS